ncbi:MAG: hypothetical protein R2795_11455 [Saprospiraceae bacterium]
MGFHLSFQLLGDTVYPAISYVGFSFFYSGNGAVCCGVFRGVERSTWRQWGNSFIIGNLFLTIGTGAAV